MTHVLTAIEASATIAFAFSGLLEAARKRLDAVGVCVVAGLAAFGGGTLRDVLLDRRPFFWVEHAGWLWGLLALCAGAMLFMRARHFAPTERAMQWPMRLASALHRQRNAGGGRCRRSRDRRGAHGRRDCGVRRCLRDIVCNEIPSAFRDHRPYAVCAFAGGWALVLLQWLGAADWVGLLAAAMVAALAWARAADRVHLAALVAGRLERSDPSRRSGAHPEGVTWNSTS